MNTGATAFVVVDPPTATDDLDRALADLGFAVLHVSAAELSARTTRLAATDVVLISASLGLHRVALLAQRVTGLPPHPAVLVFPQDDFDLLEACARAGFDYVSPPFRAGLLHSRLVPALERGLLSGAVAELAAEASLRAYEEDLSVAHEIQAGFLPERLPVAPGWQFTSRFRPAREVAGDFYDGFELVGGQRLGFLVADVCDKGVSAALFMALVRTLLRHTAEQAGAWDPAVELLQLPAAGPVGPVPSTLSVGAGPLVQSVLSTNGYLTRNHLRQGYFVTLIFAVLDPLTGGVLYINAGHNPAALIRAGGGRELLHPTGPAIGMLADGTYSLGHVALEPGDTLLLYTDGVVEARSPSGALFGTEGLLDVLTGSADATGDLLTAVDSALRDHVGTAEQSDDITMLALRRTA
jgi:sigma-B regulation protein RsbU (phosphoserine phosphatase)